MVHGAAITAEVSREYVMERTRAMLAELTALWGMADGDVIVTLFDVPRSEADRLGLQMRLYGTATVELGETREGPYRTINALVKG